MKLFNELIIIYIIIEQFHLVLSHTLKFLKVKLVNLSVAGKILTRVNCHFSWLLD